MTFVIPDAQFGSEFTIDKIQSYSITTDASTGLTKGYLVTIPAGTPVGSGNTAYVARLTNPYGKRGLPHIAWSLDQTNWNSMGASIIYYNATFLEYMNQMSVRAAVSDATIFIIFETEYAPSQAVYFQFAVDNPI